jgi:hypothetical protein
MKRLSTPSNAARRHRRPKRVMMREREREEKHQHLPPPRLIFRAAVFPSFTQLFSIFKLAALAFFALSVCVN